MSAAHASHDNCTPPENRTGAPCEGAGLNETNGFYETTAKQAPRVNQHTRAKLVFKAWCDARVCGDDEDAAELFDLWLRLLGKERDEP